MRTNKIQNSFIAGELSVLLDGRTDFEKHDSACQVLKNFIVLPQGPITKRPGWRYAGATLDSTGSADSTYMATGIPYYYSLTQSYSLIFSETAPVTQTGTLTLSALKYKEVTVTRSAGTFAATDVGKTIECFAGGFTGKLFITDYISSTVVKGEVVVAFNHGLAGDAISANNWRINQCYFQVYKTDSADGLPKIIVTSPISIPVPYDAANIGNLRGVQQGSYLFLFHPNYPPCKIIATSETTWTFQIVRYFPPALKNLPWYMPGNKTLTLSALSGTNKTATISNTTTTSWNDADKSRVLRAGTGRAIIYQRNSNTVARVDIINDFDKLSYSANEWWLEGSISGTMTITPSNPTQQYQQVYLNNSIGAIGGFRQGNAPAGDVGKYVTIHGNVIKITAVFSNAPYPPNATGYVLNRYGATTGWQNPKDGAYNLVSTIDWQVMSDAWNCDYGYPSCGTLYEQRMFMGGVAYYPYEIWGTMRTQLENMSIGDLDDAGLDWAFMSSSQQRIVWLEGALSILGGTDTGEFYLAAATTAAPLTPKNFNFVGRSVYGSANVAAVKSAEQILYAGQDGRTLREMSFTSSNAGTAVDDIDRGIIATHLFVNRIAKIAAQTKPVNLVWVITTTGELRAMTYLPEQKVYAWHQHDTASTATGDGVIESIWTIQNTGWTELWAIVKRKINGYWCRYIERMDKYDDTMAYEDMLFSDCGKTWTGSGTTITGLSHLKGRDVAILYKKTSDGSLAVSTGTVSGAGEITLLESATKAQVGLPYIATVIPARIDIPAQQSGTAQIQVKRIEKVGSMIHRTGPLKLGDSETTTVAIPLRTGGDWMTPIDNDHLWTDFSGGFSNAGTVVIQSSTPWPATILALVYRLFVEETQ